MSMPNCPISELCQNYTNGTKRRVHHIRLTEPCTLFLDMSCALSIEIQLACGETLACDIEKIKKIKEKK